MLTLLNSEFAAHISFDQKKCACVCVSCNDEFDYIALSNFDLFKELQYQLHSIFDKNFVDCSRMNVRQVFFENQKKCQVSVY